jgi:hypothetical protein
MLVQGRAFPFVCALPFVFNEEEHCFSNNTRVTCPHEREVRYICMKILLLLYLNVFYSIIRLLSFGYFIL